MFEIPNGTTNILTALTITNGMDTNTVTFIDGSVGGGGGGIDIGTGSETLSLSGCIVASNTAVAGDLVGGVIDAGFNLTNGNPLLAPLGNYGGPTQTMPPLPGSPAIDAGGPTALTTDQRGFPRTVGLGTDIGAVEGVYNPAGPGILIRMNRVPNGPASFTFTNFSDMSFTVRATTNLAWPSNRWSNLGPVVASPAGSGYYQFTDPQATNSPQRFYRVSWP